MMVFEIKLVVTFRKNLPYYATGEKIGNLLSKTLCQDEIFKDLHAESTDYKMYVFDLPYPCEKDFVYKENKLYTIRLRTVKPELAEYFFEKLPNQNTEYLQVNNCEIKIIPKKILEKIYSINPVILKDEKGYWKGNLTSEEFEERLKVNLIKKYKTLTEKTIDEDFMLYNHITFMNKSPVKVCYKNIELLGDKVQIIAARNDIAQELLYMAIGTGILENNSTIGGGFVNYRYL